MIDCRAIVTGTRLTTKDSQSHGREGYTDSASERKGMGIDPEGDTKVQQPRSCSIGNEESILCMAYRK